MKQLREQVDEFNSHGFSFSLYFLLIFEGIWIYLKTEKKNFEHLKNVNNLCFIDQKHNIFHAMQHEWWKYFCLTGIFYSLKKTFTFNCYHFCSCIQTYLSRSEKECNKDTRLRNISFLLLLYIIEDCYIVLLVMYSISQILFSFAMPGFSVFPEKQNKRIRIRRKKQFPVWWIKCNEYILLLYD